MEKPSWMTDPDAEKMLDQIERLQSNMHEQNNRATSYPMFEVIKQVETRTVSNESDKSYFCITTAYGEELKFDMEALPTFDDFINQIASRAPSLRQPGVDGNHLLILDCGGYITPDIPKSIIGDNMCPGRLGVVGMICCAEKGDYNINNADTLAAGGEIRHYKTERIVLERFLTQDSADDFIRRNSFGDDVLYVKISSAWNNPEMVALMNLAASVDVQALREMYSQSVGFKP